VRHRARVLADILHHGRSVGFFTVVAATCVLGSQCWVIAGAAGAAQVLWLFGIALWGLLTYSIFAILTVKREKPSLAEGINGGWLVGVVAAQSVSVLGSQVSPGLGPHAPMALLFCLVMWLGGTMLYLDHLADLLPLHVLRDEPVRPGPALLDQHGRSGHHDTGRNAADRGGAALSGPGADFALLARLHAVVVGDRDLVDPDVDHPGHLAPRLPQVSAALRPPVLGRGLPPRHVHDLHV
jgi:hypothetical protein